MHSRGAYIAQCIILVAVIAGFNGMIYYFVGKDMKAQMANKCFGMASSISVMLEEYSDKFQNFIETLDTSSDFYKEMQDIVETTRWNNPDNIAFLYVERRASEDKMMYLFANTIPNTDVYARAGDMAPLTVTRTKAYETRQPVIGNFVTNEWGTLLSVYVPVFHSETGEFMAIVGCDVSDAQYARTMNRLFILLTGGVAFIIAFVVFLFIRLSHENRVLGELNEAAETATGAKSRFLANMSHEMRTPLNAIIGFSELELDREKEGEIKSEVHESLEKIYSSGVTLLGLINDILDISKIESGKFELVPVNYDMPSLINDTIVLNIVRIGSKPITFELDIDENLPANLFGDELRIKQIFNNLLSNAFKYTKEGRVTLGIRCERADAGTWMTCTVSDTGMGIRKEDVGRLFGDYNQVDTESNRHIEGTGLGLAITKRMVEMMGGSISVDSVYGKGTTFTARFLQGYVNDTVIGKALVENLKEFRYIMARQDRHRQLVRSYIPYAKVLVVDDVATNLDLAKSIMKPYGMTVDCVTSGPAAIVRIQNGEPRYNAIFMDHMMPGMDGIEAVRLIRNEIDSEYARTIPIIALTANAIIGNEEIFLNNGFQAFLTKPIDIMKMNDAINRFVRDKKLEKELGLDAESRVTDRVADASTAPGTDIESQIAALIRENPVDGLDAEKGLERFGGDGKTYLDSLHSYAEHTPALLEAARDTASLPDYAITVHGIKGSSYGVSANTIGRWAEKLEHAARAGNKELVEGENGEFITTLEQFIGALRGFLDILEGKLQRPHKATPDSMLLTQIAEAAENYDMGGLDSLMEELERYTYEEESELVAWLKEQISMSEFEAITERLADQALNA
jgi:signal transduction histidine kinase/FixJ family two-component response regulator/HPt (histidine-containing phosphotransfer) domain-containing protein